MGTWYATAVAIQAKRRAGEVRWRHNPSRSFRHSWRPRAMGRSTAEKEIFLLRSTVPRVLTRQP
jgi:hypothetical protein